MFVPGVVIFTILEKHKQFLFMGVIVLGVASIFSTKCNSRNINSNILNFNSAYKGVMQSITVDTSMKHLALN